MVEWTRTVAKALADNVRTFRQLRGMEQGVLAQRMQTLGIGWRRATVSEVERSQRNVTVTELLALTLALETTIDQLLDTRGPERIRGPRLSFIDVLNSSGTIEVGEGGEAVSRTVPALGIRPEDVTALVCPHRAYPAAVWDDENNLITENASLKFVHEEQRR